MLLLKRRPPRIDNSRPAEIKPGFEHLETAALALLRWLNENQVEFVLTGEVARGLHSRSATHGPVAIVPAPYRRNLERLAKALTSAEARTLDQPAPGDTQAGRITADALTGREVARFSCGSRSLDVVGTGVPGSSGSSGASSYQELLYETTRFEPVPGLTIEVASPEDIEHYAHLRRTGSPPEMRISRQTAARPVDSDRAPTGAPPPDSPPGSG